MARAYRRKAGAQPQLFNGTVHFVQVTFGQTRIGDADQATAYQYAVEAAKAIQAYCVQYGSCGLSVDSRIFPFSWPSSTYSDADLAGWTDTICAQWSIPQQDALVFLSPVGATNTDAPYSSGILGYHNATPTTHKPYIFVNVMGQGLTVQDVDDVYATALSHELAEMVVDPLADLSMPEVCDPCAGNCGVDNRNYFNAQGGYIGSGGAPGVGSPSSWEFYTDGVVAPYAGNSCPAPAEACRYDPTSPPSTPPPSPGPGQCIQILKNGVTEIEQGNFAVGVHEIVQGLECLLSNGFLSDSGQPAIDANRLRLHLKRTS